MTKVQIEKSWKIELDEFFDSSNMVNLRRFLKEQINIGKKIYPPMSKVFNAFNRHTVYIVQGHNIVAVFFKGAVPQLLNKQKVAANFSESWGLF